MTSLSNVLETGLAKLVFQNVDTDAVISNLGSGLLASVTAGSLYASLHTADVGEAGNQSTNETSYTGYLRSIGAIARSAAGFSVSSGLVQNVAEVLYDACTGGATQYVGWWAVGTASSGTGYVLGYGAFTDEPRLCSGADSGDVFTCWAHGFSGADSVVFYEAIGASAVPGGITAGTRYYVYTSSLTTHTFQVTTDSGGGGTPVTLTSNGAAYVGKQTVIPVSSGVQPRIPAAAMNIRFG